MALDETSVRAHRQQVAHALAELEKERAALEAMLEADDRLLALRGPSAKIGGSEAHLSDSPGNSNAPPEPGTKSFLYYEILRNSRNPLHIKEIWQTAVEQGAKCDPKTPLTRNLQNVNSTIRLLLERYPQIVSLGNRTYQWKSS